MKALLKAVKGDDPQAAMPASRASYIGHTEHRVFAQDRATRNGHLGGVLWLTGLSGAGKSTLAVEAERRLFGLGYQVFVLDGDNLRHGLNSDLGFSPSDRAENIRRAGEVAAVMAEAGMVVVAAFISPYRVDREQARRAAGGRFHEIFVRADLSVCERRDPKGLYKRARAGLISDFTGVGAPYEAPRSPELIIDTEESSVDDCVNELILYVKARFSSETA